MKKASIWPLKLNTAVLLLVLAAVGINYIGKLFAQVLRLPLWLDSIGTVLSALLAGPIVGATCGAINNIIYGLTMDPISFVYGISSVGIGIAVGVLARLEKVKNVKGIIGATLLMIIISVIISTPINIIFWEGQTSNIWGDAVYIWCIEHNISMVLASILDELVVDILDKFATIFISYAIFSSLPQKIILQYNNNLKNKYTN